MLDSRVCVEGWMCRLYTSPLDIRIYFHTHPKNTKHPPNCTPCRKCPPGSCSTPAPPWGARGPPPRSSRGPPSCRRRGTPLLLFLCVCMCVSRSGVVVDGERGWMNWIHPASNRTHEFPNAIINTQTHKHTNTSDRLSHFFLLLYLVAGLRVRGGVAVAPAHRHGRGVGDARLWGGVGVSGFQACVHHVSDHRIHTYKK